MTNAQVIEQFSKQKEGSSSLYHSDGTELFYRGLSVAVWHNDPANSKKYDLRVCPNPDDTFDSLTSMINYLLTLTGSSYRFFNLDNKLTLCKMDRYTDQPIPIFKIDRYDWIWIVGPDHGYKVA